MSNIRDIAQKSGYSASTVSRVINKKGYVSEVARVAIESAIKELNYVPNAIAQDLSNGISHNIGVVMPNTAHPFFTEMINGIIEAAFSSEYKIVVLPSRYENDVELKYLEQLRRRAFDAIIFTSHGISLETLSKYSKYGPIVCCEDPKNYDLLAVYTKREPAYIKAFNWIKEQRKQNIAILLSRSYQISNTSRLTLDSFKKVYGKFPKSDHVAIGIFNYDNGYNAIKKMKDNGVEIDCIFANDDNVAAGARSFYVKNNLPVPLLLGQDVHISSELLNISSVEHHFKEMGRAAFELATNKTKKRKIVFESEFILRK